MIAIGRKVVSKRKDMVGISKGMAGEYGRLHKCRIRGGWGGKMVSGRNMWSH